MRALLLTLLLALPAIASADDWEDYDDDQEYRRPHKRELSDDDVYRLREQYRQDTQRAVRDALEEERAWEGTRRYIQDKRKFMYGETRERPNPLDYR